MLSFPPDQRNILGTEGQLVKAYAKLLNEMWNLDTQHGGISPDIFKRILGQYNTQFEGYGQHDSHECINSILDLLGEDLYRHGKKPFVAMSDDDSRSLDDAAQDTWNKHLHRNESVITDLFHGQFKSTVRCSICERISVTFDPLSSLLLPIPTAKKPLKVFFIPYEIKEGYTNYQGEVHIRGSDTIRQLRLLF
jgi:ubiquitin carboxyl-terminal hydrolase 4/11/15